MFVRCFLVLILTSLVYGGSMPLAYADLGRGTVQELVTLLSALPGKGTNATIYRAMDKYIDFAGMIERSLTEAEWEKLNMKQKKALVAAFQTLLEKRFYKRWRKLFLKGKINFVSEAKANGDTYVKSFLVAGKNEDAIIWRLHLKNGEPMVISLNVNGKDLLTRLSSRLRRRLRKQGYSGLIAWLRDKADVEEGLQGNELDAYFVEKRK